MSHRPIPDPNETGRSGSSAGPDCQGDHAVPNPASRMLPPMHTTVGTTDDGRHVRRFTIAAGASRTGRRPRLAGTNPACPRRHKAHAFTLIELLVAIAIIAILVALLLPAVQQARAAAWATQCRGRLKQLGIALHAYHETHSVLPPGHIGRCSSPILNGTGLAMLLPYLDQGALYGQLDFSAPMSTWNSQTMSNAAVAVDPVAAGNARLLKTILPVFLCPADNGVPIQGQPSNEYGISPLNTGTGGAKTNYDFITYASMFGGSCENWRGTAASLRRMFGDNSNCRFADVTDGTSQVAAMAESTLGVVNGEANCWGYRGWHMAGIDLAAYPVNDWTYLGTTSFGRVGGWGYAGSLHAGGIHALIADGAVRFLQQEIDPAVRQRLSCISDGAAVGEF